MNGILAAKNCSVSPAQTPGHSFKRGQMSKKVSGGKNESVREQSKDCEQKQGPGCVIRNVQMLEERFMMMDSPPKKTPRSHQRRWSVSVTSPVIVVRKSRKEPLPPQRSVSLLQPPAAPHSSFKRYSFPLIGTFTSPGRPSSSSSSSSSSTSSCSSPPPVQTSAITGHDPLGWKVQPKSSSSSSRARAKRLSLQIPLPVVPVSNPQSPEPSFKAKPALRPKPFRRHSESSAFLGSPGSPLPAVTRQELLAVRLRPVTVHSGEPDEVFCEPTPGEGSATGGPRKVPPPVPEKTAMARQISQLIAMSRKRCCAVVATSNRDKNAHTSVIPLKPKQSPQHGGHNNNNTATKTAGLSLHTGCDRERCTPHFSWLKRLQGQSGRCSQSS
ncbi:unnamed protein product [Menidia menidia]|uniref:(Atlantic silverside) hypothetical protein n=1 Tax=Menidia menidia TaxID=238744 RepID=A0A8S4B8G0_9TELE|nr:unnamed protein product [Menidia menidia]